MTVQTEAMPASMEAERGLLGLILWNERLFPGVALTPEHFYREDHRTVYRAIQTVAARGDAVDYITVGDHLERHSITEIGNIPTSSYLLELQRDEMEAINLNPPAHRAGTYAKLIEHTAQRRRLIAAAGKIHAIALNGAKDPIAEALAILAEMGQNTTQEDDPRLIIGAKGKKVLKTDSLADVMNYPDPEYLVPKILEIATVSLLYGESGTGKTFIALAIALAIAFGRDWLGRPVKQGRVLYFYQEGKHGLKKRVKAWLTYYGLNTLPSTIRFVTVPTHLIQDRQYILNAIEEQDSAPVLVIVDTFSNCSSGVSQNHQEEVYPILAVGHEIAKAYGSHFMFIHHDNKNGEYNGSKAFRNHVDSMLLVERGNSDGSIILCSKKARDEEPFADIALQLHCVDLDDDSSSCVVVTSEAKVGPVLPQAHMQVLEILHESGSLSSNEWHRKCERALKMAYMTWNRCRKALDQEGLVEAPDVSRGTEKTYSVTQKGVDLLNELSSTTTTTNYSHESSGTTHETTTTTTTTPRSGSSGSSGEITIDEMKDTIRKYGQSIGWNRLVLSDSRIPAGEVGWNGFLLHRDELIPRVYTAIAGFLEMERQAHG